MSKIFERIGKCWNDVNPESIKPDDKVVLYTLIEEEKFFGEVPKNGWNKQVRNTKNIILVKRNSTMTTKAMCLNGFNEEIRDATDDLCDILSEWHSLLLSEYNEDPPDKICFDNIKGLLTSKDQSVRNKIAEIAQKLGGVTKEEIYVMGLYKLARNRGAHKGKELKRDVALERLNIASVCNMSPICIQGFEKCINFINDA
ncbi:hypothetical protein C1646_664205 [Rhizophagus diaphanus]|nr:hypothetical protein C1646_664205 [Rhizophagus diaphanus] [Rhizophagus sp. MUCL 43196]